MESAMWVSAQPSGPDPHAGPPLGDNVIELGALGRVLLRRKRWVLGLPVLVAALTFVGVNLMTPRYKSEARVLIETRENVFLRPEAEKAGERDRGVVVEFQSFGPGLAARAANTVAESFLAVQQAAKQDETRAAGRWLGGEIEVLRQRRADAEAKVEGFRSKSNLFVGTNNTTLSN